MKIISIISFSNARSTEDVAFNLTVNINKLQSYEI